MLADSLGRHPELYMMPIESKVIPYFIQRQGRYGDLTHYSNKRRLASDFGRSKAYWQANGKRDLCLPDAYLSKDGFASVVDGVYRYLAQKQGKSRWGDKSPINTIHISKIASLFPDAQFVHIIRDGRDSAQSFHRRWGYDPLHTISRWKSTVSTGQQQGRALGSDRYIEITYEALTGNPEVHMRAVCDFLGLVFDPSTLESSMKYMDQSVSEASAGKIIKNSEKWSTYFTVRQVEKMEAIAGKTLSNFGYSVTSPGDGTPGAVLRIYWILKDGMASIASFFRSYGLKAFPMFLRYVGDASKQILSGKQ